MSSSKKKAVAIGSSGLMALALLAGGVTTANWSDVISLDGAQITAGNLDIEKINDLTWYERSAGSNNFDGTIDLSSYRIIPGDTIQGIQDLDVAVEGDNILAEFEVSAPELSGDLFNDTHGVIVTYKLVDENGAVVVPTTFYGLENSPFYIRPDDVTIAVDNIMDYQVIIDAYFDENTPDQVRTQVQSELQEITATIKQVRKETPVEQHRNDPDNTAANNNSTPGDNTDNIADAPERLIVSSPGPIFDAPVENGPINQPNPFIDTPGPDSVTPYQTFNHATEFTADGKMLVAGGQTKVATQDAAYITDRMFSYTDDGNGNFSATEVASLPEPLAEIEFTRGLDGKIYLPGGGRVPQGVDLAPDQAHTTYSNKMYIYDPATNSWSTGADMPQPRKSLGVTTGQDGKIYAVGGYYYGYHSTVMIYDPVTDSWSEGASFPSARGCNNAVTAPNGKIYCYSNEKVDTRLYIYDPANNTWESSTVAPMWFGDVNMTSIVGDYVVIAGGQYYDVFKGFVMGRESTSLLIYNTVTDEWGYTDKSMETPKYGFGMTEIGSDMTAYINGGYDMDLRVRSDIEAFDFSNWSFVAYPEIAGAEVPDIVPTPEPINPGVISTSWGNTAFIKNGGEVWFVGDELGSPGPVQLAGIDSAVKVDVDGMALLNDGTVATWGSNSYGSRGVENAPMPGVTIVPGLSDVVDISMSNNALALKDDGTVVTWGGTIIGQAGTSGPLGYQGPTVVPGVNNVIDVSGSERRSYAVHSDGSISSWNPWGYRSGYESMLDMRTNILGIDDAVAIDAESDNEIMVRHSDGTISIIEDNNYSDSWHPYQLNETEVPGISNASYAANAYDHYLVVDNGELKTWGYGDYYQLGNGSEDEELTPYSTGITDVLAAYGGEGYTIILMNDGTVKGLGDNYYSGMGVNFSAGVTPEGPFITPTELLDVDVSN